MSVFADTIKKTTDLKVLADFAQFILDRHYEDFLEVSLRLMKDLDVPLLNFFSDLEATKLSNISNTELLLCLSQNNCSAHIQKAIDRWKANQLRTLKRNDVVVNDITRVGYSRTLALLNFLPLYTSDSTLLIELVKEIDAYVLEYTSSTFKAFVEIMDDRMEKHVERLEESEARSKQAQALAHIGNYAWDLVENKLTWSDELYRIYEIEPVGKEITNASVWQFNHPEDAKMVEENIRRAREKVEPFSFYHRIVVTRGQIKTLHIQGKVMVGEQGQGVKLFGTVQDVTEQKETEAKLLENQTFIQRIADATPAIIASYNVHTGKYTFINHGVRKLLGYDPQQVLDEGIEFFTKIIHPDDSGPLMEKNTKALLRANESASAYLEPIVEFQYRMKHRNGEFRWFHTFGTIFHRNAQGHVEDVLNISLDITERVKAENILLQRTHELQQSNASLEEFAYVASHDLKEPLRKISMFTSRLALSTNNLPTSDHLYLQKIVNASLRMQQMIDDLLSLSLISASVAPERSELETLLQEVLQTFEHKIQDLQATVASDGLPRAMIVPSQIRQLFQNLISNSLKFVRAGQKPFIKISHRNLSAISVAHYNLRPASRYLELTFADNGIGFEKGSEEKIFAVFHRLHHKHEYEGTGIGLAICRKIVKSNGGAIFSRGNPNQGAIFTVILPQ